MSHAQNKITFQKDDRLFSYNHHPKPKNAIIAAGTPLFHPPTKDIGWHCWQSPEWIKAHSETSPTSKAKNKKFYERFTDK